MTTTLKIQNLKCDGCSNTIVNKLSKLGVIGNVRVNNNDDSVFFDYYSEKGLTEVRSVLAKNG